MLILREEHHVVGRHDRDVEALHRDVLLPALADGDGARLLWYCRRAHGTGPSYRAVTLTALADGSAYGRLAERRLRGDLATFEKRLDAMRRTSTGSLLLPVEWSPLQGPDVAAIPTTPAERGPTLYLEDTGWPYAPLDDYVAFWGRAYHTPMQERENGILEVVGCFVPAHGAGRRPEATLWQRITDLDAYARLLERTATPTPPPGPAPTCTPGWPTATGGPAGCCEPRGGRRSSTTAPGERAPGTPGGTRP